MYSSYICLAVGPTSRPRIEYSVGSCVTLISAWDLTRVSDLGGGGGSGTTERSVRCHDNAKRCRIMSDRPLAAGWHMTSLRFHASVRCPLTGFCRNKGMGLYVHACRYKMLSLVLRFSSIREQGRRPHYELPPNHAATASDPLLVRNGLRIEPFTRTGLCGTHRHCSSAPPNPARPSRQRGRGRRVLFPFPSSLRVFAEWNGWLALYISYPRAGGWRLVEDDGWRPLVELALSRCTLAKSSGR